MVFEIPLESVLTPDIKRELERLHLAAVGVALIVEPLSAVEETHTVTPGETLSKIAKMYNTTVDNLAKLNDISNPNMIHVDQILKVR